MKVGEAYMILAALVCPLGQEPVEKWIGLGPLPASAMDAIDARHSEEIKCNWSGLDLLRQCYYLMETTCENKK